MPNLGQASNSEGRQNAGVCGAAGVDGQPMRPKTAVSGGAPAAWWSLPYSHGRESTARSSHPLEGGGHDYDGCDRGEHGGDVRAGGRVGGGQPV